MKMIFPLLVGALDLCATFVYCATGNWRLAIIWFCYAIVAVALGGQD